MKMTGSGMVCHHLPGGSSHVSSWTTASPVHKISSPHQQLENRKPDKLTITVSAVTYYIIHTQYFSLIIFHLYFQFCATNSSDILYKYSWRSVFAVIFRCCSHVKILSLRIFDAGTIQYFRVLVTGSLLFVSPVSHVLMPVSAWHRVTCHDRHLMCSHADWWSHSPHQAHAWHGSRPWHLVTPPPRPHPPHIRLRKPFALFSFFNSWNTWFLSLFPSLFSLTSPLHTDKNTICLLLLLWCL